jgi:integrase
MASVLREFAALPGVTSTSDFTTVRCAEFATHLPLRNVNTTISRLKALRTASMFSFGEGWTERLPQWSRLFPRAAPPVKRRHLDHDQVVRLLEHLGRHAGEGWREHRLYALASVVAYTGLRRNEALRLQLEDLDATAGVLQVVARLRLKTVGSAAPVALPPELAPILERWTPSAGPDWLFPGWQRVGPWQGGAPGYRPGDRLAQAGVACGVPGVGFHALRHTWGKLAVGRFGLSREQVRTNLRHGHTDTTEGYLHRDDAEGLRIIGRSISFRPPSSPA